MAVVPDGVYDFLGDVIRVLQQESPTIAELQSLSRIIEQSWQQGINLRQLQLLSSKKYLDFLLWQKYSSNILAIPFLGIP
ncbi:hypothetical protein H6F93_00065 [Leptolyngbya sp. FACHB-671]|nr:hypothetical protein [Leptolyngbya sp. FACHB-671]